MPLEIKEDKFGDVLILDLEGRITIGDASQKLHQTIRDMVERGERKIILNLSEVTAIDSSGLGELVGGYATLQKNGGELKLLNLPPKVNEIMTITKLVTVFQVFDDETAAMKSFGK